MVGFSKVLSGTEVLLTLFKIPESFLVHDRSSLSGNTSMITGELKSKIDAIWNTMWSGGISNPLPVIEQLTY